MAGSRRGIGTQSQNKIRCGNVTNAARLARRCF